MLEFATFTSRKGCGRCTVRPNAMRRNSRALQAVSGTCHNQIQREKRAIVLVVDDGTPLVSTTFCIHAAYEAAFTAKNAPSRAACWITVPLTSFLAMLLKNTTAREEQGRNSSSVTSALAE